MSRSTTLLLVVLGAALAGFAFASAAGRVRSEESPRERSVAAGPQTATLGWRETYGPRSAQLVFEVEFLEVFEDGWRARVGLTNETSVPYRIAGAGIQRAFGLMLFATGEMGELVRRNDARTLPTIRPATLYEPKLPAVLEPHASWRGTISAPGALVAGSWVRVVFGVLLAAEAGRDELDESVVWITDHTYRLRP